MWIGQCFDGQNYLLNNDFVWLWTLFWLGELNNRMGNCFKAQNNDDISLLRGSEGQENVEQALGPPPPYQVCLFLYHVWGYQCCLLFCVLFRMFYYIVLLGWESHVIMFNMMNMSAVDTDSVIESRFVLENKTLYQQRTDSSHVFIDHVALCHA